MTTFVLYLAFYGTSLWISSIGAERDLPKGDLAAVARIRDRQDARTGLDDRRIGILAGSAVRLLESVVRQDLEQLPALAAVGRHAYLQMIARTPSARLLVVVGSVEHKINPTV